ncbi:CcoQ/FixQ family Cbb3-type cytochrome c oxidase assembly chaperone [Solitalea longa]|uniref:CcoQ/FixQ family Cbb3-type cytochrome c oxidase assembly chaperone n=1 Tax=Solitalea longa TaxID=2079460 RepID=A0A2S5A4Q8_9SPHI|nr:CcoQ/FixQ family Cbb3-type cytochrome c oxidase assembly chaperone [Solitalea longa]POY37514.1 CcoQ/FixQ family Cbb3-type cytochrome c oxidase assembly chaperone [Solitalea longa]
MKFINYLETIAGVGIYPLISLLVFFIFFVLLTLYVIKAPKKYIDEASHIPLDGTETNSLTNL